ncbi:diphosphomevalonate decarboxylase [Odontomachus brunneus]|uniref:diphosphomevalonate decarboxylase n=1 Tax=Odontomachus brunneus TaxID=486640 RepID=UPI0013F1B3E8|nr:diphosphomevalonate decarboxylase [Odontomachus brunneus]XP_032671429.1 diphosphomevalonate decarboxylase [Odontomachus brunneus]XP_032671430.1 diphosphomevalonate decarboxylase [Odontomachus brunneus]XP_032671431.1 diphosphomevalonate decarboxylase [Odontomachus brunneus]XP_032671432.1 diphosphomevalonate decarboxylase [Odontomachus brunneus]XP_032671433.1 diphosphomevalonate decarboxylase [Odontomachus brunneus]
MNIVTCLAPINIAVIKYWGKRDESLILPTNDSISATLDINQLCAKTTVMISQDFKKDCIWLNEREEDIKNPRLQNCLNEIRKLSQLPSHMNDWKIHISSNNNFPTAAGLASSAAGYACLTAALAKLYKVECDISLIARSGSGSACRSVLGGFVRWHMGSDKYGTDSLAKQIAPVSHWPEMRILLIVVNGERKKVSSTIGMKKSMETSELMQYRIANVVPERVDKMQRAIIQKDFKTFAELTMKDSNQMHAICLDTYPPFTYMNNISHSIINFIHSYNDAVDDIKVAYTYDAGPNATLYLMEKDVPAVMGALNYFFPPSENIVEYKRGLPIETTKPSQDLLEKLKFQKQLPGQFQYIIHTKVGDGPKYLYDPQDHLLDGQGNPIKYI